MLVTRHLVKIRSTAYLRDCFIVFIPEANLAHEGSYQKSAALRACNHTNIEVPVINKSDRDGIITTDLLKDDAGEILKAILARRELCFMEEFIVANPWDKAPMHIKRNKIREKLVMQMGGVRDIYHKAPNPFAKARRTKSGKCDAKGIEIAGRNDDMWVALALAVYIEQMYATRVLTNSRGIVCR